MAALSFGFFGHFLWLGQTLAYDDLGFWFFPWKSLLYRMACQHHISFWLPYEFCGMPHVADIQRQIFYPPNAIFYLVPTATAMVLFIAFHFFVASVLMFVWLRQMRPAHSQLEVPSAVCGALVFAFAAFPVLHLTQLPILASYTWIPGLMWALERYWQLYLESGRISTQWLVAGGMFFCLLLLGGAPQMVFIACFLAAAYGIFLVALSRQEGMRPLGRSLWVLLTGFAVPLFGVGLSALQIVPMAELAAWSTRQPEVSAAYSAIGTANPDMLWTFVAPYVFGNPADGTWHGGYTFHEECFYVGVVALLLSAAALVDLRQGGLRLGFFVIVALFGVVVSLGNHVSIGPYGFHDVMRVILPGFSKFRVPPRWMVLTVVGVSVLTAYGANALCRYRAPHRRDSLAAYAPLICATLAAMEILFLVRRCRALHGLPAFDVRWTVGLVIATLLCGFVCHRPTQRNSGVWLLAALVGLDLVTFSGRYVRGEPSPALSPNLRVLHDLAGDPSTTRIVTHTTAAVPTQIATWCAPLGVRNIQGSNPLFLRPFVEFLYYSQCGTLPSSADAGFMHHNGFFVLTPVPSAMFAMLNPSYVIDYVAPGHFGADPHWNLTVPSEGAAPQGESGAMELHRFPDALGEAWAVPSYRVIADRDKMLATMYESDFNPRQTVFFSDAPAVSLPDPKNTSLSSRIAVVRLEDDALEVSATVDHDAIVVFSEVYYPGWRCKVDGVETAILRANDVLRAVSVKAGAHRITMEFRPTSFLVGLIVTCATALVMLVAVLRPKRPRRPRSALPAA